MEYQTSSFVYIYLIAGILSVLTAIGVFWRRASPGSLPFTYLLLALAIWSLATVFEASATQIADKVYWSKWQYIGIVSIAPFWLYFVADFTGWKKFYENPYRHLIWLIPLATLVLAFTNEYHGLIWTDVYIPPGSEGYVAIYKHGIGFKIHTFYSYSILLFGSAWLIKKILAFPSKRRSQVLIIISMLAVGWISNLIYVLGLSPIPGLDLTPLSFTFIVLVLAWFIFRKRLFDVIPIARSKIVDNMTDGLIIIGPDDIVIDVNPAALEITGYEGRNPIGMSVWGMFSGYKDQINPLPGKTDFRTHFELDGKGKYLDVKIDSITQKQEQSRGRIITIRDITERKRIEAVEREQRKLAEALADTAAVINSSLGLDEVLEKILENVGKVVPHETANVALLDQDGMLHFVKARGYEKYGTLETVLSITAKLEDIPNMHKMASTLMPSLNPDTYVDPDWVRDIPGSRWIRSYIGAPIHFKGKTLGFLNLDASTPNFFQTIHLSRLQAFADQAAVAIQNAQMYEEKQRLAITDSLTGLYNRRFFFTVLENEVERSKRYEKDLSLIMMDIDHFKQVNDIFGHQVGDNVLKSVVDMSLENLRKMDVMCRFGGEEFIILLPETARHDAVLAAVRICRKIEAANLQTPKGDVSVTVSIGVTGLNESTASLDDLISVVDDALYKAKEAGRNCVRVL